jgi:putative membrane-bound dehydrogenase-like protein
MVRDPVAFDWDEHGQLWVLQMGDYPNGVDGKPAGEIWVLRDTSGDGLYDNSTLFMSGIPFPTGIQCWRDGVLVSAAPDIFFAADRNNDWQADVKKVLYRGFGEGNQQHRVNGLRLGLDNWVYVGNGDSGGDIKSLDGVLDDGELGKKPSEFALSVGKSSSVNGRDLRIRPDFGWFETQSGQTQFGRSRDDWGNWFGCNNSDPMWHYLLSESYLRRNPNFAFGNTRHHMFEIPGAAPVFPRSRTLARYNDFDRVNRFTSACSTMIFRDTYLGNDIYGNSFTSEPVHNLVSRRVISEAGSSFRGARAKTETQSEFLSSTDSWFRPTMIRTGPDGALWVADMYRFVIEHPKWIPADWQRRLDLQAGSDMGRIYRIVPEDNTRSAVHYLARSKDKDPLTGAMLVQQLEESNGWRRDTAQRILVHRQNRAVVPALVELLAEHKQPLTRLHALCTLDGLGAIEEPTLLLALGDSHPGVRRHAIRLSESELKAGNLTVTDKVVELLKDTNAQTQIQLAYSLGYSSDPRAAIVLAALLDRATNNRALRGAVISSFNENNIDGVLRESLKAGAAQAGDSNTAAILIGQAAAFKRVDIVLGQFKSVFETDQPIAKRLSIANSILAAAIGESAVSGRLAATAELKAIWQKANKEAIELAINTEAKNSDRITALAFLARTPVSDKNMLISIVELVSPQVAQPIQFAAIDALSKRDSDFVPRLLLNHWRSQSPSIRAKVVDAMLGQAGWTIQFLDAISNRSIGAREISSVQRQRLVTSPNETIRTRAAALLADTRPNTRKSVLAAYRAALTQNGDPIRGRAVFTKTCAACHKLDGIGKSVGADLATLKDRSKTALLTAILDPNRAVESKFVTYTAIDVKGRNYSGLLASESGTALVIQGTDGKQTTLLRRDLDELVSSTISFMPEGLEKELSIQAVADVMAFVQSAGRPPKQFPGMTARTVTQGTDGVVELPASAARIYGPSIVFEQKYKNLGYWQHVDDYAAWDFTVEKGGKFNVEFDYAVEASTANGQIKFTHGKSVISAKVPSTGTWDDYKTWRLGTLSIAAGQSTVTVSAPIQPSGALIDLRAIRLIPVK